MSYSLDLLIPLTCLIFMKMLSIRITDSRGLPKSLLLKICMAWSGAFGTFTGVCYITEIGTGTLFINRFVN